MGGVVTTEQRKNQLTQVATSQTDYVKQILGADEVESFKSNFMELASNDYLLESIDPKEVLVTAVTATKMGLNINPAYNELYILPFKTKKGKKASIVPQLNGMQQMAYDSGFFLTVDYVWLVNGEEVKESEMSYAQRAGLNKTSYKQVQETFLGVIVKIEDISQAKVILPLQEAFVDMEYLKEVTNQLINQQYAIQAWTHKAVRSAMKQFVVPRARNKMMALAQIEAIEAEAENTTTATQETPQQAPIDPLTPKPQEEAAEAVIEESTEDITEADITVIYRGLTAEAKANSREVFEKYGEWREADSKTLKTLAEELKSL